MALRVCFLRHFGVKNGQIAGHFWVVKVGFGQVAFGQDEIKVAICPLSAHF